MNKPIGCQYVKDHLNAYLDSELDMETRRKIDRHAEACPECGERLESMTRLLTMCAELDEGVAMPLEGQAAWRKAVREEALKQKPRRLGGFARALSAVAAALVLWTGGTFAYRTIGSLPLKRASVDVAYQASASDTGEGFYYGDASNGENLQAGRSRMLSVEADGAYEKSATTGDAQGAGTVLSDSGDPDDSGDLSGLPDDRTKGVVVLRSAQRALESATFDKSLQSVQDLVAEYEGYFERKEVSGQAIAAGRDNGRVADLTVRMPVAQLDEFLTSLDAAGTVVRKSETAEDISGRYYDSQTRLTSAKTQIARLNQLVSTAAGLEDMLLLQDKIDEAQQTIDSLEGEIRAWDSRANYSTVEVQLTEIAARDQVIPQATALWDRVKEAFYASINWLNGFLQDATVVLAMAAPLLVIALPLILLIWLIVLAIRRRRRGRHHG